MTARGARRTTAHASTAGDNVQPLFDAITSDVGRIDQEVVELPLLLPRWQAMELEAAASRRGTNRGARRNRFAASSRGLPHAAQGRRIDLKKPLIRGSK